MSPQQLSVCLSDCNLHVKSFLFLHPNPFKIAMTSFLSCAFADWDVLLSRVSVS